MNDTDKKKYIIQNWQVSSGTKIAEMLKRFWKVKNEETKKSIEEEAETIFNGNTEK